MKIKNIIFIGTNNFASKVLVKLIEKKTHIDLVITKNDNRFGRGRKIKPYPVKVTSKKNRINIHTVDTINANYVKNLLQIIKPEIIIVVEYGEKICNELITIPKYGIINLHPSILPKFRGPQPIQHAIISSDIFTGVSIIKISNVIDAGDILMTRQCKISKRETYNSLSKKLINVGYKCLLDVLHNIEYYTINVTKQGSKKEVYAKKFDKDSGYLNWNNSAFIIDAKIRAFIGIKKFSVINNGISFKIIETSVIKKIVKVKAGKIINITRYGIDVSTGKNILRIKKIQFLGKNINTISNLLNSNKIYFKIGDILI